MAGKDLSDENLTPLINGILAGFDEAYALKDTATDPLHSARYRASIEQAYAALIKLGVSERNTQALIRLLYRAADRVARPLVRPIPPG